MGRNPNSPKIIHFDESDKLTKDAQNMLRNLIEERSKQCRFIFTCNNINEMIDALKIRCVCYYMKSPDINAVYNRIEYICKTEDINKSSDDIRNIVANNYPDIRSMIKSLMFANSESDSENVTKQIYESIKSGKVDNKLIYDRTLNHRVMLKELFEMMYDGMTTKQVEIFAEADYRLGHW